MVQAEAGSQRAPLASLCSPVASSRRRATPTIAAVGRWCSSWSTSRSASTESTWSGPTFRCFDYTSTTFQLGRKTTGFFKEIKACEIFKRSNREPLFFEMVQIPVNSVNGLSLGFCGGSGVGRAVSAVRQPAPWCSRQPPGVFFCWPRATAQLLVSYSMSSLCADNEPILFTVSL